MRHSMLLAVFVIAATASAQERIVDLEFTLPPSSDSAISRLLPSVVKVQEPGGPCQNGLFLMTHYGDREDLFDKENQNMIENPLINRPWRYCSVFSTTDRDTVLMGRNWDNENVGSVIINLYYPTNGFASISFARASDMGFALHADIEDIASSDLGEKLIVAPVCAYDGINEHGLAIGIAGSKRQIVEPKESEKLIYIPFLVRKILDRTKTLEEAIDFVQGYVPFDLDKDLLHSHLFVVDISGRSAILEYFDNQWQAIYGDKSWQVMSTKPVYNVPDSVMRENCWRFRRMSESLEQAPENQDWKMAMRILENVAQRGTTWSAAYSLTTKELYFSVYQHWETVYHSAFPRFE